VAASYMSPPGASSTGGDPRGEKGRRKIQVEIDSTGGESPGETGGISKEYRAPEKPWTLHAAERSGT